VIHQGDVFWFRFRGEGSEPDGKRPCVVVQHDRFNRSAIRTVVVAAITSNIDSRGDSLDNVLCAKAEAGLTRFELSSTSRSCGRSNRERLRDKIGTLSPGRVADRGFEASGLGGSESDADER